MCVWNCVCSYVWFLFYLYRICYTEFKTWLIWTIMPLLLFLPLLWIPKSQRGLHAFTLCTLLRFDSRLTIMSRVVLTIGCTRAPCTLELVLLLLLIKYFDSKRLLYNCKNPIVPFLPIYAVMWCIFFLFNHLFKGETKRNEINWKENTATKNDSTVLCAHTQAHAHTTLYMYLLLSFG